MTSVTLYAVPLLVFIFSAYYISRRSASKQSLPLPPGPPALPIIGNLHQAPSSYAWQQYHAWGKQYGPVVHLNMAGQSVIVLTTSTAAHDLLAKQGAIFSDRPHFVVASELALKGMHMLLRPYDARFKLHQRLQSPVLNERAASAYSPFQELESKQLLYDLLETSTPDGIDCHGQIERTTASVVYALLYGHRMETAQDPMLLTAHAVNHVFDEMVQVGAHLVDAFPALNVLPGPLAPWKAKAAHHWEQQSSLHLANLQRGLDGPGWNFSKQMKAAVDAQGIDMPSVELALDIGIIANAALDGSVESLMWFLVACVTKDHDRAWIAKAQDLLDTVVGRERFPSFDDRPKLQYIDAILEEVLRWRPAGPGGVPHFTKVESTYEGLTIPKNSVVLANHYSITREESVFGLDFDVDDFKPERWLREGLPTVGFGYGRRICPGRHVARNSLWISIARILWAFNVKPGLTEAGEPIVVDSTLGTDNLVHKPYRFKVYFEPRGQWARDMITKDGNPHKVDHSAMLDRIGASLVAK